MSTPSNPRETNPSELFSPFLPTTYNIPEEEDRHDIYLVDNLSNFADIINDKKIGVFTQAAENFSGEKWFYKTTKTTRNGYQTIAFIPSFPNAGVLTLTLDSTPTFPIKDIDPDFVISEVFGSASKPCSSVGAGDGNYFSFMAQGDSRISFTMSDTTITITTTIDMTQYSGFIIIQYIREGV